MNAHAARRESQPRVLDLTASQRAARVAFDVSPAYELIAVLQALASQREWSTYDQGVAWFENLRSRMSPQLRARLEADGQLEDCPREWGHLAGLISEAPDRDSVEAVIDHLASLPAETFYRSLLDSSVCDSLRRQSADVVTAAAAGEPNARERLREIVAAEGDERDERYLDRLLADKPAETQNAIVAGLREAAELLKDYLDGIMPALRHDAEVRREQVRGLPIEEAVEVATSGIHWRPEAGIRRVLLIPHAAMRPWVLIGEHADTKIFMVAASEESLAIDLETPPARLLTVVKALGEEQRLRILRRLAVGGPASLQQLADHIGVAKSTAHHHLVQLRAAGLTIVELNEDKEYRLRDGLVGEVAHLLDTYLRGGAR